MLLLLLAASALVASRSLRQRKRLERLTERVGRHGFARASRPELEREKARAVVMLQAQAATAAVQEGLDQRLTAARIRLFRGGSAARFLVGTTLITGVWLFLFLLLRRTDVELLAKLGYAEQANTLGTLLALTFSLIGMIVADVFGVTGSFPGLATARRGVRIAVCTACIVGFGILWAGLPALARQRAEAYLGVAEANAEKVTVALQNDGAADPTEQAVAARDLQVARQRLDTGRRFDGTIVRVLPVVEAATSWAPFLFLEFLLMLPVFAARVPVAVAGRGLDTAIQRRSQRLWRDLADAAIESDQDPAEIDTIIAGTTAEIEAPRPPSTPSVSDVAMSTDQSPVLSPGAERPSVEALPFAEGSDPWNLM